MREKGDRLRRALRHTRIVISGSPPLYRLLMLGVLASGLSQLVHGEAPLAVMGLTSSWFSWCFIAFNVAGSTLVLLSLYMTGESRYHAARLAGSLYLERVGLCLIMSVLLVNVLSVVFYYHEVPPTGGVWLQAALWAWCWSRLWGIRKALRGLTR